MRLGWGWEFGWGWEGRDKWEWEREREVMWEFREGILWGGGRQEKLEDEERDWEVGEWMGLKLGCLQVQLRRGWDRMLDMEMVRYLEVNGFFWRFWYERV